MTNVAGNVRVAVTGAVYVGPVGTAAPVDADTALNAAFKSLGYLSEDGVSLPRTVETSDIKAWQNSDVVRSSVTSDKTEVKFTMIETNAVTMGLFWGKTIAEAATSHKIGGDTGLKYAFVVDVVDGDQLIRYHFPEASITNWDEVVHKAGEPVGYGVTLLASPVGGYPGDRFYSDLPAA